jgi:molecular chaperone GrpE
MSEDKENTNGEGLSDEAKTQAELEKAKKDYLYLLADFDNYRKNAVKERSELIKYGSERFVRDFLNVFDNFERALEAEVTEENLNSFREGIQMMAHEFRALLNRHGVNEVKAEGEPFDPTKHEALSSEPRSDMPPNHVATVFKKAYTLNDKLIRPAQVTVSTEAKN